MNTSQQIKNKKLSGLFGFTIVMAGQLVSVLASYMSNFAISIWAYEKTGSATVLGILSACFLVPFLLVSPIAGAMVDRYNRKLMMMVSDLGAVLATGTILILNATGHLQIWHFGVASVVYGLSGTFQWPAYMAAITTMVPKEQLGRANGMMMLIDSGPGVFSPILAGLLLPIIGLTGILSIDVITFFIAIGALLIVFVPQPVKTKEGQAVKGNLLKEGLYGFKYIFERKSLLSLLLVILGLNIAQGLAGPLITPMILSRTNNNTAILGGVNSAFAIGAVASGLIVSAWGGFKKNRIRGMLLGWAAYAVLGLIIFGLGRGLAVWLPMAALSSMTFPLTQSASNTIWQNKVAPDIQGRVFSARRMIAWLTDPIMPVIAGVLADKVTEPAMQSQTWLSKAFGGVVGTTPGSGMALHFLLAGVLYLIVIAFAWFIPAIRNVETILPDHDQLEKVKEDNDSKAGSTKDPMAEPEVESAKS
jgi:DHA3 family macrolide efflux protein-like MFS transporter